MTTFLLLLLIFFVIIPIVRTMVTILRARRSARQFFEQFTGNAHSGRQRRTEPRHTPEPEYQPQQKKIDPDEGEFVAFEDLPAEPDRSSDDKPKTGTDIIEPQIVDAEWEEIK